MTDHNEQLVDELLVMECQDGSVKALDTLVRRWQKRLWRYALRLTGSSEAAPTSIGADLDGRKQWGAFVGDRGPLRLHGGFGDVRGKELRILDRPHHASQRGYRAYSCLFLYAGTLLPFAASQWASMAPPG